MPVFGLFPTAGESLYGGTLRNIVRGRGQSPAQIQLARGYAGLRNSMASQGAALRGNPALGARNAMNAAASAGSQYNLQQAELRAREQQAALQMQGQDAARTAAGINAFAGNVAGAGAGLAGLFAQMQQAPQPKKEGMDAGPNQMVSDLAAKRKAFQEQQNPTMPAPMSAPAARVTVGSEPMAAQAPRAPRGPDGIDWSIPNNIPVAPQNNTTNPAGAGLNLGVLDQLSQNVGQANQGTVQQGQITAAQAVQGGTQQTPVPPTLQAPGYAAGAAGPAMAPAAPAPAQPAPVAAPPEQPNFGQRLLSGLGQGLASAVPLIGGIMSDERAKTNIKNGNSSAGEFLDALSAKQYQYRDQQNGQGEQTGVMAQALARTPVGRQMVIQDPNSGMLGIDASRAVGPNLAAMAYLNDRLDAIERRVPGPTGNTSAKPGTEKTKSGEMVAFEDPGEKVVERAMRLSETRRGRGRTSGRSTPTAAPRASQAATAPFFEPIQFGVDTATGRYNSREPIQFGRDSAAFRAEPSDFSHLSLADRVSQPDATWLLAHGRRRAPDPENAVNTYLSQRSHEDWLNSRRGR